MTDVLRIALPVPVPWLFDYLPPTSGPVAAGCRVRVPFGSGTRIGLVAGHAAQTTTPSHKLKRVQSAIDAQPLLDAELLDTLAWAGEYWLGAPGDVLFGALPVALRGDRPLPGPRVTAWSITPEGQQALARGKRRGRSRALLNVLDQGLRTASELDGQVPGWRDAARRLERAGLTARCQLDATELPRVPVAGPALNDDQRHAVDTVLAAGHGFQPFALEGVTGSGKTEVYLALMQDALARGRQVLMLVPEISLTPQTVRRLRERLGTAVEVLHSGLPKGERAGAWLRARRGQARVILGTRSAIFTPLPHAGLIVVDEEHDTSYKQQDGFRYHARDLAVWRARTLGIPLLLGSATLSLETLYNIECGRYQHLRLPSRVSKRPAPRVQLVDLRARRLRHGLSDELVQAIETTSARAEQTLVFRNRRGYAPILMCHACGWHVQCGRCDKAMTLHEARARLVCHHCGSERPVPQACPECGATSLHPQGYGTERIEDALKARFPQTPVWRIDSESVRRRGSFARLMDDLQADAPAILIGTQILAKGHDFGNLTLVAITSVDEGLFSADFRASERLAQLVVQIAGRAGRAHKRGQVLLQTHHPDHPFLRALLATGYTATARELLDERRTLHLPPCASQALLRAEAPRREAVEAFLTAARGALPSNPALRVLGPMPAPMPRRAGRHRGQILLEADRRHVLHGLLRPWRDALWPLQAARKVRWSIDVDPVDLY